MRLPILCTIVLLLACGDDDRGPGSDAGRDATGPCDTDDDCDDGHECTIDSCGVGNVCRFDTINERCTAPQICEVGRGCVDEPTCMSDADCNDGFDCTLDSCAVGGECRNMPLNELCSSVGPGSTCDPATGMAGSGCTEATGCMTDGDCDDAVDCTLDTCGVDMLCDHTAVNERCGMNEVCTATGCFESTPCEVDDDCQDTDFCNGREFCEPEFGCQPAPAPRICDDSDDCTVDACDSGTDMCTFRCDPSGLGCDCPMPEVPCNGTFDITPTPSQDCSGVGVSWSVRQLTFTCVGDVVQVGVSTLVSAGISPVLTQTPRSSDGTFDVRVTVGGTCDENYRIEGRFIDADTFEGTWSVTLSPAIICDGFCAPMSAMITGTRVP